MSDPCLESLNSYAAYVAAVLDRPSVIRSTVVVWSNSPFTGNAEGEIFFKDGFRLRIREELDFDAAVITSYGYEVYQREERLYWYDDFPHPNDPKLASSFPHHKHEPPDIKRNRVPAPCIRFDQPNLSTVVGEIESLPS